MLHRSNDHAPAHRALFLATVAALSAWAAPVAAQDEAATLDRVEVTAQRRAQDIGDVPLAVTAIDARALADLGASGRDVLALGNRAPSLQAESSFGRTFPRFYIRGLGNNDFDLNASQPVSLVVDGIVMENPTLKGFPVFDLERVEVLRGPQGSLFGRNTPGGVVQFISARPSAEPEANVRLGYGTYDTINAEAVVGGGSETSAWRVSALHQQRGAISTNRALADDRRESFEDQALRAQWLTRIGENTEALLQLRYRDLSGGSAVYRANVFVPGSNNVVPGFDREALDQDAVPTLDVETRGLSLHLDGRWGALRWASITSWDSVEMFARGDVDGGFGAAFAPPFGPGPIPFPAESGDGIPDHRQWTQEFRLHSDGDGATQWLVGAFFFNESLDIENISYDTLAGSTLNGFARQTQDNRSEALFGSLTQRIAADWELTLGGRYTRDRKDFVAERLITPFGGPALGPIRVNPDDSNLSGDLALTWHANDDVQVYGRVASGYRAPAIQGRVLFGDTVSVADSEEILSAEVGLKAELLDRRARLAVAAYRYTLDDAQLTAVGGGANFNTLLNADRVIGTGLEFELLARLSRAWQVAVGGSWNDSEIDDPNLAVAPCGAGCTVFDPPGALPGTVSIDGNPLVQTPKRIAFARVDWSETFGAGEVFASADVAHRSEVNFFLYESAEFTGKPLTEVGARLGYRWDGGRHTVSLYGRNLGDQVRAIGGVDFNNLTGFFNEPRVVGIEWQGRF
jgi:iron complex outermembrane receptor protein